MKPTREKTNFENLRKTPAGELDLSCDWGGRNTKFMLYGRDKEDDFFIPIGILKKPMGTVATLINRAKKQFKEEFEKTNIKL